MEVEAHHIEGIDMESVTGLLAYADGDEGGEVSSPLAIHVYSKLAKLHRHSLIPYLPRIMASVLSSLSCSPQLHPACTQVVTALAAHTIDSSRDPASNEDTLRNLCRPFLSALSSSHPPHLASGAASCLQTLVESDRWRCAPLNLQELVCTKGMQALTDEGTQTVAHMDLMRSLAKLSSSVVIQGYGVPLLGAGMNILQNSRGTAKRVAAAQLLESVLQIADAELLDLDLSPIVGVLQECQQDKVAGVRTAVADALRTASMYATYDTTSHNIHRPGFHHFTEESLQQSSLRMQMKSHLSAPISGYNVPDAALPNGGTPCHSTVFTSMPSSNKSDKWLKRLPLAPLRQSSRVNTRRRPATFKLSDYKENIAPAHNTRLIASSRDQSRGAWVSKRESPILWPKSAMRETQSNSSGLFDSPQTPIVPFCGDSKPGDGDFSVNTLLEKHFGKQRDCFEDQFQLSNLGKSTANMTGCSKVEICYHREEQYPDGEVCNSFDQDTSGRRSTDSISTNMCCGTEELDSPNDESASDCESSITLEQGSKPQVTTNQALAGDLVMTPKRLICSLQYDDEYQSNLDQENLMESDAGMSSDTGCGVYDSSESEEYDKNSKVDTASTESMASSPCPFLENYNLHCEGNAQMNKGDNFSDMQEAETPIMSNLKNSIGSCSEEYKIMRNHNKAVHRYATAGDEGEKVDGDLSSVDIADGQINPASVEITMTKPTQGTPSNLCLRLWGKGQGFLLLFIVIGVFCAAATYMGNSETSNMLVPT